MISKFLFWMVWDSNIRLGRLAPYVFGLAIGRWPKKYNKGGGDNGKLQDAAQLRQM